MSRPIKRNVRTYRHGNRHRGSAAGLLLFAAVAGLIALMIYMATRPAVEPLPADPGTSQVEVSEEGAVEEESEVDVDLDSSKSKSKTKFKLGRR